MRSDGRKVITTALAVAALVASIAYAQKPPKKSPAAQKQKVLLALFAHPDDETIVAPVLAAYARQGVKVYLMVATDGRMGIMPHAGIPAGDELARVRHGEVECAAKELGIEPPMWIGLPDAGLAAIKPAVAYPGEPLDKLAVELRKQIDELDPQVIISWGPEGAYGHPDHRLVGDVAMQVFQEGHARTKGRQLYWIGYPPERVANAPLWHVSRITICFDAAIFASLPLSSLPLMAAVNAVRAPTEDGSASGVRKK